MTYWTNKMNREAWMTQLRNCGLGNHYKGRNKDVEDKITNLLRKVIVPFYNGRNPDSIYLREAAGGRMYVHMRCTYHMYILNIHTECT